MKACRFLFPLCGAILFGCGSPVPVRWQTYANWTPEPVTPAFQAYEQAGVAMASALPQFTTRTSLLPKEQAQLLVAADPLLVQLRRESNQPFTFSYTLSSPFKPRQDRVGWQLLGEANQLDLVKALSQNNFDQAIADVLFAFDFGMRVSGGDILDAELGYSIIDAARATLAPRLSALGASQLETLSAGISEALKEAPSVDTVVAHNHAAMLNGVDAVQQLARDGRFDDLEARLGGIAHDAIQVLKQESANGPKLQAIFNQMAAMVKDEDDWFSVAIRQPAVKRAKEPDFRPSPSKPWKALGKGFITIGEPYLEMRDRTLARTRLMEITCDLLVFAKTSGAVPSNLRALPPGVNVDPYSGAGFLYVPNGKVFLLYSVGANGVDDGGQTDASESSPDLFLEGWSAISR